MAIPLTGTLALTSIIDAGLVFMAPINAAAVYHTSLAASAQYQTVLRGTFVKLGMTGLLYISEFVSVTIINIGFLQPTVKCVPAMSAVQRLAVNK